MKEKRTYKDSLFRDIFNDKRRLQGIYEALTGKRVPVREIQITTLRGTFFNDIKNDISFLAGNRYIVLLEHQSTISENMPLRMLWYIAKLYRQRVNPDVPYKRARVPLPMPQFFVFYNGTEHMPETWTMRLSDAFPENEGTLELTVSAFNINYAEHRELLEKCRDLKCYSIFVARVRDEVQKGATLHKAIADVIRYCKENDILKDYFAQREQEEVFDMVSIKWEPERAKRVWMEEAREQGLEQGLAQGREQGLAQGRKEGREEGRVQGREEGRVQGREEGRGQGIAQVVVNMLKKSYSYDEITALTGTEMDDVLRIAKQAGLAYN